MANNVAEGIGILLLLILSAAIAIGGAFSIKGSTAKYYVGRRTMSSGLVGFTLSAQFLTAGAVYGNFALIVTYGFWFGFALPLGLALCLFLSGSFLAKPLRGMKLSTLSDFYFRRFGSVVEVSSALVLVFGTLVAMASDMAGIAYLFEFAFSLKYEVSVTISIIYITTYTMFGGIVTVAWTDVVQTTLIVIALVSGFIATCVKYPDELSIGLDQSFSWSQIGVVKDGALIFWATIVALSIGDFPASDLMERIFSAKTFKTARNGCFIATGVQLMTGLFVSLMACAATQFIDTEVPDFNPDVALLSFVRYQLPRGISVLIFVGIASMAISTGDGCVLASSTILTRNVLLRLIPTFTSKTGLSLLWVTRLMAIPCGLIGLILALVIPSPGTLLILAWDLILAGCVAPLLLGIWWSKMSTEAALTSIIVGSTLRLILHFTIPEHLAGAETLIPPLISTFLCVVVSLIRPEKNLTILEDMRNAPDDMVDDGVDMAAGEKTHGEWDGFGESDSFDGENQETENTRYDMEMEGRDSGERDI